MKIRKSNPINRWIPLLSAGILLAILFAAVQGQAAEVRSDELENDQKVLNNLYTDSLPHQSAPQDQGSVWVNELPTGLGASPYAIMPPIGQGRMPGEEMPQGTGEMPPGWQKALEQGADLSAMYPRGPSAPLDWGGPDPFGYTYLDSSEPGGPSPVFEDISPFGTLVTFSDFYELVDLPFAFPYYGETFTQAYLYGDCLYCWNDWTHLAFGNPYPYEHGFFWMDNIDRDSGAIYIYSDTVSSPARFIIQYDDVFNYSYGIHTTSQVLLYENGDILIRYAEDFDWWQWYFGGSNMPFLANQYNYFYYTSAPQSDLAVEFYYPEGAWLWPAAFSGAYPAGESKVYKLALYNDTGSIDSFDLSASGNLWATSLSPAQTDPIPDGELALITVTVDIPPGALPGDQDQVMIQATSISQPGVYTDTAWVNTTALCSPGLAFEGRSDVADNHLDDLYDYGGQGFTYIYLYAYQEYDSGFQARVSGYNPLSGEWESIVEVYYYYGNRQLVNEIYIPPVYTRLRVEQDDWGYDGSIYYDYQLVVCRTPAIAMHPLAQQAFSQPGETAVYTQTLTNYMMALESFNLRAQDNQWPVTFWEDGTQITQTGVLEDLETFTFNVHVEVPAGEHGVADQALVRASSENTPEISAEVPVSTVVLPHRWALTYRQDWAPDGSSDIEEYVDILRDGTANTVQLTDDWDWQNSEPAVAAYPREAIVAAWSSNYYGNENIGYINIEYMALKSNGDTVVTITQVSDNSEELVNTYDENVTLAVAPSDGNVLFGWQRYTSDSVEPYYTNNIHYAVSSPQGSVVISPTALTNNQDQTTQDTNPSAASFGNGNFAISWLHYDQSGSWNDLMVAVLDSTGTVITGPINLTAEIDNNNYYPSANRLADGNVIITWMLEEFIWYQIYYTVLDEAGNIISPISRLTQNDMGINSYYPDAVGLQNGKTVIAWSQYVLYENEWGFQIAYTLIDEVYTITAPFQVLTNTAVHDAWYVSLARDAEDNAVFSWRDGSQNIYGSVVDDSGSVQTWPYLYLTSQNDRILPQNNHASGSLPVPVLSITKTAMPDPVEAGSMLTYTLVVSNAGFEVATGMTVVDTLPEHTTFVSASAGGALVGGQVLWEELMFEGGNSLTLTLTVQVESPLLDGTEIVNSGYQVSSAEGVTAHGLPVVVTVHSAPLLDLMKSASPNPVVVAGDLLTYTITVENLGNANATQVVISDVLPMDTTFVSADMGGLLVGGQVEWSGMSIHAGEELSVHLVVLISAPFDGNAVSNIIYGVMCAEAPTIVRGGEVFTWVVNEMDQFYLPIINK